jgi:glycosyltransferase involved in cell wall biosynthesis
MIRPRTPRRQPHSTTSVLERLADELGAVSEIRTFGCTDGDLENLTRSTALHYAHLGLLKRDQVADLLRNSDIFLDMSTYQAFGRTALEAMACGCAAVVPRRGGVWEFVEQDANAVVIDTLDRERAYAAVAALAADPDRLARLQAGAVQTAAGYSALRAAISEYVVMLHAFRARFG